MFKKFKSKTTIIGLVGAIITGVTAFVGELDDQKRDRHIEDIEKRLQLIESKTKEEA
jgi:hypothetical protein